jgi:hypothetical protein
MRNVTSIVVLLGLTLLAAPATIPAFATTYHVPDNAPTIQAGIDSASYGDTVLVACGTYYEHGITMKSGITLLSETGDADCVTIDAQGEGRLLGCESVNESTLIKGFTLTNGAGAPGSAMYCWNSSPTLTRIRFENNGWGEFGCGTGALVCRDSSSPRLTDCEFILNCSLHPGGGMACWGGSPVLERVVFDRNFVTTDIEPRGAGMICYGGTPTFIDVLFSGNEGGMTLVLFDCTAATLTRVTFDRNGGGAEFDGCSPALTSCTFYGNGLECIHGACPVLEQTIIAFGRYCGICCVDPGSQPVLECCDIFGNENGDWVGCIEDQFGINGNISEDPLFCDPENGDLTLQEDSPCAPFSPPNEECDLIGAWSVGCGPPTVTQQTTWGRIKVAYR